jgi:hypothetical protein
LEVLTKRAKKALEILGKRAGNLKKIADFMADRKT